MIDDTPKPPRDPRFAELDRLIAEGKGEVPQFRVVSTRDGSLRLVPNDGKRRPGRPCGRWDGRRLGQKPHKRRAYWRAYARRRREARS